MSVQSIIMKNRRLTNLFMSSMSAEFWEKTARKKVIANVKQVIKKIPAYGDFLKRKGIQQNIDNIFNIENFKKLPIMDKQNYILKYPIEKLTANLDDVYTVERSSGYSNISIFWPRLPEEDVLFPSYIEYAFVQFYNINVKRTLVVTTLALGTWVSGEKMAQALRITAAKKKYKLTVASPGANIEDTLEIIQTLSHKYEQTIIVGYPPFVKSVLEQGDRRGIAWKKLNIKIGLGGEGYSEKLREYFMQKIGADDKDLLAVSGGYGAADLGMTIGREYPLTVIIKKIAGKDNELAKALFKSTDIPALLQYNPASCYIEEHEKELLFTIKAGIPVIRYNIHDRGGVIGYNEMVKVLKKFNYNISDLLKGYNYTEKDVWRLPFFYVFGRSDGTVCVSGMNVYIENIEAALHSPETDLINSFKISKEVDNDKSEKLCIILELKNGVKVADNELEKLKGQYQEIFLKKLLEVNKDYKYVYNARPDKMKPIIKIFNYGQDIFAEDIGKIKKSYIKK